MRKQPDAVFIVDLRTEQLAVREARRLGLPIVALVDTNCDPDDADYVVPGNDDAIRSCSLIIRAIADGIAAGQSVVTERDFARPADGDGAPPDVRPREEVAADPTYEQVGQAEHLEEGAEDVERSSEQQPVAGTVAEPPSADVGAGKEPAAEQEVETP